MDGISIAASIAGLVQAADFLARRIFKFLKYAKSVKDYKKDISELSTEVLKLYGTLQGVSLIATQLENESFGYTLRTEHVSSCQKTLEMIDEALKKHDTTPSDPHSSATTLRDRWFHTSNLRTSIYNDSGARSG